MSIAIRYMRTMLKGGHAMSRPPSKVHWPMFSATELLVALISIPIFLGFGAITHAAVYYVATDGNDANPGTEELPWGTIGKCSSTLSPGDTCIVQDGVYQGDISISRSGSPENPITITAKNKRQAVLYGTISVPANFVRIVGLKVVMPGGSRGGMSITGNYNEIRDCFITTGSSSLGLNNTAMGIAGSNNKAIGNYVEKTCFGYALTGTNHLFESNEAFGLKLNGNCGDVDYMRFFGSNHIIRNNLFHGINPADVGSAHVDCFQTFDNGGPEYAVRNIVIEGNYCSDAAEGMMLEGRIYKQSGGLVVRNNIFRRCGAWCVCLTDIADAHFYNNTCDTTGGLHGIWCRGNGNIATCEFKNNIIYGTGTLYGVFETAQLIDGTPEAPGKGNLLYKPGVVIEGFADDIKNVDPLFVDVSNGDYRLKRGSPAIDSGVIIANWLSPKDKDGNVRPAGNGWDIGAYEFVDNVIYPSKPEGLRILEVK
jgi:hypothetical protein